MSVEVNSMMLNVYQFVNDSGILNYSCDQKITNGRLTEFNFHFKFDEKPKVDVSVKWTKDVDYDDFKEACLQAGAFQLSRIKQS